MTESRKNQQFPTVSRTDSQESADRVRERPEFEGYEILDELPQGGQAVVYKAIHKATKMKVALKVLLPGLSASAKARRRFEQEVELAASLNHPNIVAIRDSGIAMGQYYFAMEYIHGQPLDRYPDLHNLSFREKVILFGKVCDAVAHAHQRGVIHRDLKPSNILVDDRGEPHILDFGLAKAAGRMSAVSGSTEMPSITGQIKGTLAYMSPEQAAGRSDLIDVRTDVYSLGIVLYQMLLGTFPYDISDSMVQTLQYIQQSDPIRPRQMVTRFNSDVEAILLKTLAKDPNQRYQSAAELQQDLRRWLEGLPIMVKSVSSIYLLRKIIVRHYYSSAVIGLLLVIVVGFSCVYYQLYTRLRHSNTALKRTIDSLGTTDEEYLALAQQVTFTHFLDVWHKGQHGQARSTAGFFSRGTREDEAVRFLLDERPLSEKTEEFREKLQSDESFFAGFVMAEHHLRDGNREEAIKAYRGCLEKSDYLEKNDMLRMRANLKLNELTGGNQPRKTPQAPKD